VASKTQEIIAKCLKQFDKRLFEEIGGSIAGSKYYLNDLRSKIQEKKKRTLRAFASRAKKHFGCKCSYKKELMQLICNI
jgi:hypothetical protein